jgi:hypothetical protein
LKIVDAHRITTLCGQPSRRRTDAPASSSDHQSFQDVLQCTLPRALLVYTLGKER